MIFIDLGREDEDIDAILLTLTPCAGVLYQWLLLRHSVGEEQEFDVDEFSECTSLRRSRPYSIRHIQRSLDELVSRYLVTIVRQFNRRTYKLVCCDPQSHI